MVTPTAHASPSICTLGIDCNPDTQQYLAQIASAGITGNNPQTLISSGMSTCASVARGNSSAVAAAGLRSTNPGWSLLQGNAAVDAALLNLCPQLMKANANEEPVLLPLQ
jgi:hypothetical protein